jgi:hypothetical protein
LRPFPGYANQPASLTKKYSLRVGKNYPPEMRFPLAS